MTSTNSTGFSTRSGNGWGFDVLARATRQAVTRTVRVTTKKGNLSMGKTLRSRIAAVVVTAMGGALLVAAPATADTSGIGLSLDTAVYRTGNTLALKITSDTTYANDGTNQIAVRVTSVPSGVTANSVEVGDQFYDASAGFTLATSRTVTIGRANQWKIVDGTTPSYFDTYSSALAQKDNGDTVTVGIDPVQGLNIGDALVGGTDINGDGDYYDNNGGNNDDVFPTSVTNDYFTVAGTYGLLVWIDENGDGLLGALEARVSGTISVGGEPAGISIVPKKTSVAPAVANDFWIYVTDAAGRPTTVSGTGESVNVSYTPLTGSLGTLTPSNVTIDSTDTIAAGKTYYVSAITATAGTNGTYKVTANFLGSLTPLDTDATSGTITVIASSNALALEISTAGLTADLVEYTPVEALDATNTSANVYANPLTMRAISFTVYGTPGTYVPVTLTNYTGVSTLAGTTMVSIGTAGTGTYSVSPTSVTELTSYKVGVPYATGNLEYTVDFDNPNISCAASNACSISVAELPVGVTKAIYAAGSTVSYTVTVADQFNSKYSGYTFKLTTASTSRNASKSLTAVTDVNGRATLSYTDASTSTTTLTDSVTLAVYAPASTVTNKFGANNTQTVSFGGALASLTLSGGSTATTTVQRTVVKADNLDDAAAATADVRAIDNVLLTTSTGTAASGYAVTYTGTAGLLFIADSDDDGAVDDEGGFEDATASVTVPNGTQVFVLSTKPGVGTITVIGGGLTKTTTVTFVVAAGSERNVAVSSAATGSTGSFVTVTATVTDGFGNPVPGASVTFQRSGGRFVAGASSVAVLTDAAGTASADVTSDAAGSVTVTARLTTGQFEGLEDDPVTGFAAASGSKSAAITFSAPAATKSAAEIAAEAATAEAAKATAEAAKATAAVEAAKIAAAADAAKAALAIEALKAAAAADAAKAALAIEAAKAEAAKATAEAAKATAAIAAVSATVTSIQTAIATLVASVTATLTAMSASLAKIMKKLKI